MNMRKINVLSAALLFFFLASAVWVLPAAAQEPALKLEDAIVKAKSVITIPPAFTEFTYTYDSYNQQSFWRLTWNDAEGKGGLNITVDAYEGDIWGLDYWRPDDGAAIKSVIMMDDAQKIAEDTLARLIPDKSAQLVLLDNTTMPLGAYGDSSFRFNWQRYANGIPVLNDTAFIYVNSHTGEVMNYSLNWTSGDIPSLEGIISGDKAEEVFRKENSLSKRYLIEAQFRPLDKSAGSKIKSKLVIGYEENSAPLIDAYTGALVNLKAGEYVNDSDYRFSFSNEAAAADMQKTSGAGGSVLSPQEIAEMEKNNLVMPQGEAVGYLLKYFSLSAGAVVQSSGLGYYGQDNNRKVWNISWNGGSQGYISAGIDANTGRIYNFSQWSGEKYKEPLLKREEAQRTAEDFLKKIEPQFFGNLRLEPFHETPVPDMLNDEKVILPDHYTFTYTRMENGIPCPGEGISINISAVDRSVQYYSLTVNDIDFPAAAASMDEQKLYALWLEKAPMTLCYVVISNNNGNNRLVTVFKPLAPDSGNYFSYIDAVSGICLNYRGEELTPDKIFSYQRFTDTGGHFAEKEIVILGQAGLLTQYGNEFHPNENIVWLDYLKTVAGVFRGQGSISGIDEDGLLQLCKDAGYIKNDVDFRAEVTHAQALQVIINALKLEHIAVKGDIFNTPFPEDESVTPEIKGFVSLGKGLDLFYMPEAFNAGQSTTRGETAYAVIHAFNQLKN
ncbi:MAG: hypothetical protein LBR98_00625 [Syntrophomonadaceae bacterium]|jgi:hypothetical protein|nr:hypothetical protein [Syntrophomonadaceae bacterium]